MAGVSRLPVEVELAFDVMPCQAMRRSYDSPPGREHPCSHFAQWGVHHSYDYREAGPPAEPGVVHSSIYAGKRPVVPEILSGCRKAPILAVGINPNLPGWSSGTRNAIHPYFEDYLQYAHYFRWRATDKLRIPRETYERLRNGREDQPFDSDPLMPPGEAVDVELSPVTMYNQYQTLLDGLAARMGWTDHRLQIGEDLAYANMVACGSARWTVSPVEGMPTMGPERARGIVSECFHERQHFLRQMLQSLPAVVIVFSQTTANAFITAMSRRFTKGDPKPQEPLRDLLAREIRLEFGTAPDGERLDARVIFSPHASSRPEDFAAERARIIEHLADEVERGRLALNVETGHLARKRGGCVFCENSLYSIGACNYRHELRPLSEGTTIMTMGAGDGDEAAERAAHLELLGEFTGARDRQPAAVDEPATLDDAAATAPRLVLLGKIVPMDGSVIAEGAIYLDRGEVVAVEAASSPAPEGFDDAVRVDTLGVIYPGLADLHNHLAYNILSLWAPAAPRTNRSQWLRDPDYRRMVSMPMEVVAGRQDLLRALIRYVEVKLLLGGVTSGQGMVSRFRNGPAFAGLVRNYEQSDDPNLPSIRHRVPDIRAEQLPAVRSALESGRRYFFHLAEGIDERARNQFTLLQSEGLLWDNLVCVHSLGLRREDLDELAANGASVVWSPFSNTALYGRTLDVGDLLASGVRFALGSDWTPSGSRNTLEEMKIAYLTAEAQGVGLTAQRLSEAVTAEAASIAGWGDRLGKLRPGYYADLVVIDDLREDPYENLLHATEREVRLVVIAGHARHGDAELMRTAAPGAELEDITVGGRQKAMNLRHPSSPLNHIRFADAREALERALADLPAARDATVFEPFSDAEDIEVELDMQADDAADSDSIGFLAEVTLPNSVKLDGPTVIDDPEYWEMMEAVPHLPAHIRGENGLRRFYR